MEERHGAQSIIGSMVYRLDFDLGLHRLAAAADGSSGHYRIDVRAFAVFIYVK